MRSAARSVGRANEKKNAITFVSIELIRQKCYQLVVKSWENNFWLVELQNYSNLTQLKKLIFILH